MRLFIVLYIQLSVICAQDNDSPSTEAKSKEFLLSQQTANARNVTADIASNEDYYEEDYELDEEEKEMEEQDEEEGEGENRTTSLVTRSMKGTSAEAETSRPTDENEGETTQAMTTTPVPTEAITSETIPPQPTKAQTSTRNVPRVTPRPVPCLDKTNPNTGISDCPFRRNLCNQAGYAQLMRQQCPRTCGFCGSQRVQLEPSIGVCTDLINPRSIDLINPRTGHSDCPNRRPLCRNRIYQKLMREQCPRTCGYCTDSSVISQTPDQEDCTNSTPRILCITRRQFCHNRDARIREQMEAQCAVTCGLCSAKNASP
ncbi:hypothetical protein GCK32_016031 [Trichostrongylus colubriformis]|uniref:ShKT domain-containing protein n=1 Tax=Trichostrongylus colubriformis TaxID=6319 RepID=A0AAN8I9S3_TRICO